MLFVHFSTSAGGLRRALLRWAAACLLLTAGAIPTVRADTAAFDIARYRGQVVVVDFWASWCKPCRQSIPWLNEMRSRYASRGLVIIGVNVDANRADAERFLQSTPISFQVLFDPDGALARRYELQGMPSTLVFGRDGTLVTTHLGFRQATQDAREADLRQLLEKAGP